MKIDKILEYTHGKTFDDLNSNSMLLDAVIRNLMIIGEASKHVPKVLRQKK